MNYKTDFPILNKTIRGKRLVYLDNAATTQKPQIVIDALEDYYSSSNSNVHRGVHYLSQKATGLYEDSREKVRKFINADSLKEVIFTKGTTDGINLVAQSWGRTFLKKNDEILISQMEHHSNIVPWQILCEQTDAVLKVIPISDAGELDMQAFKALLTEKTKLVSIVHVSNSLGTVNPIEEIILCAHAIGALVLIDGAQAIQHMPVDVKKINCDFYVFSGHKLYGPTGIGILYGKKSLLEKMPPYQGGGDMIRSVSFEKTTYNDLPYKFEAGTPHIAGAIGLGVAIDYVQKIGFSYIIEKENQLLKYATEKLLQIPQLKIIGNAKNKASVVAFVLNGVHPHDIGTIVDEQGVAIRAGHHCTQPVMDRFNVPATVRASVSFYNEESDIDILVLALKSALEIFQ